MSDLYSAFTGSIPENYDRYLGPIFFHGCAEDLVRRVVKEPVDHLLEIAAGTGIASRYLRDRLPPQAVMTVSDLNRDMLDYAGRKFSDSENVQFQVADAMALPFEDAQFDTIASQFGIMFCPDKVQVFREAHRVLVEQGRIFFSVWNSLEHNPLPATVNKLLEEFFESSPPAFLYAPFSYSDPDQIQQHMQQAGWDGIELISLQGECEFASPEEAAMGMITGSPLGLEIEQRGDVDIDGVVQRVAAGLQAEFGQRDCRVPMRWTVISASKSSGK